METQKIANLLNNSDDESSKFATKKWYIINDQNGGQYGRENENFDIIMPMYNLLEYSDYYADSSGSLWQFKKDEQNMNNGNPAKANTDDSSSFKYK